MMLPQSSFEVKNDSRHILHLTRRGCCCLVVTKVERNKDMMKLESSMPVIISC